jgi:hypothetical protein
VVVTGLFVVEGLTVVEGTGRGVVWPEPLHEKTAGPIEMHKTSIDS